MEESRDADREIRKGKEVQGTSRAWMEKVTNGRRERAETLGTN